MTYSFGDVVIAYFPNSNRRTGKKRPALVVQVDNLNTGIDQCIVAMITSNLIRAGHPSRLLVQASSTLGHQMGLLTDSVIMTDNLATTLNRAIDKQIGRVVDMSNVQNALRYTFGL
jgi:mRNA interferase MazF